MSSNLAEISSGVKTAFACWVMPLARARCSASCALLLRILSAVFMFLRALCSGVSFALRLLALSLFLILCLSAGSSGNMEFGIESLRKEFWEEALESGCRWMIWVPAGIATAEGCWPGGGSRMICWTCPCGPWLPGIVIMPGGIATVWTMEFAGIWMAWPWFPLVMKPGFWSKTTIFDPPCLLSTTAAIVWLIAAADEGDR